MDSWQIGLIAFASVIAFAFVAYQLVLVWAKSAYQRLVAGNAVSVDKFVGGPPSSGSCLKVLFLNKFNEHGFTPSPSAVPLTAKESSKVPGLWVTERAKDGAASGSGLSVDGAPLPLVVGTIRMGFGHHRIAYAATSWGLANDSSSSSSGDRRTLFHDLLNVSSPEAEQIRSVDAKYSRGSRLASELGGVVESFWGSLTKSGDEDSLRVTYQWGEMLVRVLEGLDRDSPVVATHSLVANAAVALGFTNVVNLVIDNHAQWFVVVPGALNLVQGPSNYHNLLRMGVPSENLRLAGHWIPKRLVEGAPEACERRRERARHRATRPLRLLIPVGGAGAQRKFIVALVKRLAPLVKDGKVQLFLNAGDHAHMKAGFIDALTSSGLDDYDTVSDMDGVLKFRDRLLSLDDKDVVPEPDNPVTLFAYDDYFTAVATTDILCEVTDVLACKPSELAFYPVPKLMIRRVGDHEAYSALRASELGDGTLEARTLDLCSDYVRLFLEGPDLMINMNDAIERNATIGVYDGCKNAIRIALERANK